MKKAPEGNALEGEVVTAEDLELISLLQIKTKNLSVTELVRKARQVLKNPDKRIQGIPMDVRLNISARVAAIASRLRR